MTVNERTLEIIKSKKGLSQKGMARVIGVPASTVNYWMREGGSIPADNVKSIADYLGVTCEYLLTGSDPAPAELSEEDRKWFSMLHQLPEDAKPVVQGMLEGYVKREQGS